MRTIKQSGKSKSGNKIPEWANEYALIVEWLSSRDFLEGSAKRLRVYREGGYSDVDIILFFILYFTCSLRIGIKRFSEKSRQFGAEFAAIGSRIRWPTSSSVSRYLGAVSTKDLVDFSRWFLFDAVNGDKILRDPIVTHRDVLGNHWHVFDLDNTVTTLRQRSLPENDELPKPQRRTEDFADPGYPGRKRGEVQISRSTLQHSGSGLWLGAWIAPGNGKTHQALKEVLERLKYCCDKSEIDQKRAILRIDGAGGNVPTISECQSAGIQYIVRSAHYSLFDYTDICTYLDSTQWYTVPSSETLPRRQAAELSTVTWFPSRTEFADGGTHNPTGTRMVVSRFPADHKRGAGKLINGWQYELYATNLSAEEWPASEIVTAYYGRTAQENRFYQEDQELGLDRIFSYNIGGQELATLIGLFTWNQRICRGFELAIEDHPYENLPMQSPTTISEVKSETTTLIEAPSAISQKTCRAEALDNINQKKGEVSSDAATCGDPETLSDVLDQLNWPTLLQKINPRSADWQWSKERNGILCPNGAIIPYYRARIYEGVSQAGLIFRAPVNACRLCEKKAVVRRQPIRSLEKTSILRYQSKQQNGLTRCVKNTFQQ